MSSRSSIVLLPVLLSSACDAFKVSFNVDTNYSPDVPMEFTLGELGGDCSDPLTHTDYGDGSWSEYQTQKVDADQNCQIDAEGEMNFLDMQKVHDEVEQAIRDNGQDPATVTVEIDSATVKFKEIALVDADGNPVSMPNVLTWNGDLTMNGTPLASFEGADTTTLLDAATSVDLTDDQVAMLNQAYQDNGPVLVHSVAQMVLDMASAYATVSGATQPVRVAFKFSVTLHATGTGSLL